MGKLSSVCSVEISFLFVKVIKPFIVEPKRSNRYNSFLEPFIPWCLKPFWKLDAQDPAYNEQFDSYKRVNCHQYLLPSANEVCEGYVFTRVCHYVHGGGVSRPTPRGRLGGLAEGGGVYPSMHWDRPPQQTATAADGTHPTRMRSCCMQTF